MTDSQPARRVHGNSPRAIVRCGLAVLVVLVVGFVASGVVPGSPTDEDRRSLLAAGVLDITDIDHAQQLDYPGQAALLTKVVEVVHQRIPGLSPIPPEHEREPEDVIKARSGLCYDRARLIEKALRLAGFEVRHVFLLYGGFKNMLSAGSPTHAMLEVRTAKGWMFVGTLTPVLGLDADGRIWSMADLRSDAASGGAAIKRNGWIEVIPTDFVPLIGVYSRNGKHYWPYTAMPEYSPTQVVSGMID